MWVLGTALRFPGRAEAFLTAMPSLPHLSSPRRSFDSFKYIREWDVTWAKDSMHYCTPGVGMCQVGEERERGERMGEREEGGREGVLTLTVLPVVMDVF